MTRTTAVSDRSGPRSHAPARRGWRASGTGYVMLVVWALGGCAAVGAPPATAGPEAGLTQAPEPAKGTGPVRRGGTTGEPASSSSAAVPTSPFQGPAPAGDSGQAVPFRRHKVFPLPIVFYTPETRWAGGAGGLWAYRSRPEAKPIAGSATFVYTQNSQVQVGLAAEGYTADERWHGAAEIGFQRFPNEFFGIGNENREELGEDYTSRGLAGTVELKRRVATGVYVGAAYGWWDDEITDLEGNGPLSAGVPGDEGGMLSALAVRFLLDTRDRLFTPTRGTLVRASVRGAGGTLGGDYDFASGELDARRYLQLRPGTVLAVRGVAGIAGKGVPFQEMPSLGGQEVLRGYYDGRFRDRARLAFDAEVRTPVWWRMGVVGFAGAGQVAPSLDELGIDRFHAAGGLGLRFLLDRAEGMNLRIDFGLGEDGSSGMYITVGEAI